MKIKPILSFDDHFNIERAADNLRLVTYNECFESGLFTTDECAAFAWKVYSMAIKKLGGSKTRKTAWPKEQSNNEGNR